jgi:hypothetical protein
MYVPLLEARLGLSDCNRTRILIRCIRRRPKSRHRNGLQERLDAKKPLAEREMVKAERILRKW